MDKWPSDFFFASEQFDWTFESLDGGCYVTMTGGRKLNSKKDNI